MVNSILMSAFSISFSSYSSVSPGLIFPGNKTELGLQSKDLDLRGLPLKDTALNVISPYITLLSIWILNPPVYYEDEME